MLIVPVVDCSIFSLGDEQLDQVAGGAAFIGIVAVGTIKIAGSAFMIGVALNENSPADRKW